MTSNENEFLDNSHATENSDIWELVAEGDWLVGQRFAIAGHAILGRDSGCDITIPGTHLSRRHAELEVKANCLKIVDLNSANGTYVNDERVMESELKTGDTVRFDVLRFRVQGPEADTPDMNATMIRQVTPLPKAKAKPAPAQAKNWKTKPTSVGNREETIEISRINKAANSFWTVLAVTTGVLTLVAIGYMIMQL